MKFIIEHLSKRFEQKEVLKDIDFTFEEGRIYGLLGRNGAGKTTLFNCLNRDIKADSGSFYIEENGVRREVAAEDIGYVLSTPGGGGGGHRVCPLHAHGAGVPHRPGVPQVLCGHQF